MLGPAPHIFQRDLVEKSFSTAYTEQLKARYRELQSNSVPVVFSLMHLSVLTGVSWLELREVVKRFHPGRDYKVYPKLKRSGGRRWISVPVPQLRAAQSWIAEHILNSPGAIANLHPAATAYAPGSGILKNARTHAGAPWILRIDIQSFFESISERQVYLVFRRLGYCALLSFEMARITTRVVPYYDGQPSKRQDQRRWKQKPTIDFDLPYQSAPIGHLPQGAPSSPMLSNLVFASIDHQVQAIADSYDAIYTRYADDLVLSFSTGDKKRIEQALISIRDIVGKGGFSLNRKKTKILGPGARKIVTGLLVDSSSPRLTRRFKAHLTLALFHLEKRGIADCANWLRSRHPLAYIDHLTGLIQFAHSIEPDFAQEMFSRLEAVREKEHELVVLLESFAPAGHTRVLEA